MWTTKAKPKIVTIGPSENFAHGNTRVYISMNILLQNLCTASLYHISKELSLPAITSTSLPTLSSNLCLFHSPKALPKVAKVLVIAIFEGCL
jgi:hypothetical protein